MTALELSQAVGKIGFLPFGETKTTWRANTPHVTLEQIRVQVRILDAKTAYGNARYLITPVSGSGQTWVNADRVQIEKEEVQS